jgi:DNA-binding transcriptional regulator YhcF (GntR family)
VKIWLSKNGEVPVIDQLVEQITLGIASRDLDIGERLPSTREMARRFQIHSNTVLAAYRRLAERGLVQFKQGSGVYVSDNTGTRRLDQITDRFIREAISSGFSYEAIAEHCVERFSPKQFSPLLLVESDPELRSILLAEIEAVVGDSIDSISFEDFSESPAVNGRRLIAMYDEREKLAAVLADLDDCIFLQANSVPASMSLGSRPGPADLIAVVSDWDRFIFLAKMYLLAADVQPEVVITRSPSEPGWRDGLDSVSVIICDSVSAGHYEGDPRVNVFPLVAEESLRELRP